MRVEAPGLDLYLANLVRFGATGMILSSGGNVTLRFPVGDRFASQKTSHAELVALVEQVAPQPALLALKAGCGASFEYDCEGRSYGVRVEAKPSAWKVLIAEIPSAFETEALRPAPAPPAPRPGETGPVEAAGGTGASLASRAVDRLLHRMGELGASDLHLSTGCRPHVRLNGEMKALEDVPPYAPEVLLEQLLEITPEKNRKEFEDRKDTDFGYTLPGVSRYRANLFWDRKGPGGVFRAIPFAVRTPEELGLPKGVLELCYLTKGLVLATGPTGCGKSTTLATLIDFINQNRRDHIITVEDPIEFVHENKNCLINQREVHSHTRSFKDALRAALREDPDIILVGEMRDLETIAIAVETAETGHLVFGTLHTSTAPSTVDRIIDQFPADRQEQIRQMVAESLRGIIAQTLCRKIGGGRMAAYEILLGSSAVSNLIREKKAFQLFSLMQTGRSQGMMTMNDSLVDLVKRKLVDPREAYMKSINKAELKNHLDREGIPLAL